MYTICSGIENRTSNVQIFHVSISVSTLCAVMIYEARSPTPRLCSPAPFLRLSQWRRVFWLLHSVLFTAHCNSLYFYALCLNLSQRTLRLCTLKACTLTSCTRTQSFVHSDPISYPCANSDPRALPWNQYTLNPLLTWTLFTACALIPVLGTRVLWHHVLCTVTSCTMDVE